MFILSAGTETLTTDKLQYFVGRHMTIVNSKYRRMEDMYTGQHAILRRKAKAEYKPDNRIVANFAKYIVDTFNGYFIGVPVKVSHEDDNLNDYLQLLDAYNDLDDSNAELAKMASIYGTAFELLYTDETGSIGITSINPKEAFVIYDDSILHRPLFGVRYYKNADDELEGSWCDRQSVHYFNLDFKEVDVQPHVFDGVPLIEYVENEERIGTFETVETLINAYDKAVSEKANDVDYYADAYLKVLGATLDEETLQSLRDSRIINMAGNDIDKIVVEFMGKPEADQTQENLIDRIERLIFQLSMVANISDESFGSASGVALAYKLQPMSDMAKTKERKFTAGMQKRYRLVLSAPTNIGWKDDWMKIGYKFTRNVPKNLLEESQVAQNLTGITSEETQLSVLSIVGDPKDEMEKKDKEMEADTNIYSRTGTPEQE